MERSRQRAKAATRRESVAFRLPGEDRETVHRICEAQLYLTPAHFYETAVKMLIDRTVERYPHLAPAEATDDAA
jgi:hypothetical protein